MSFNDTNWLLLITITARYITGVFAFIKQNLDVNVVFSFDYQETVFALGGRSFLSLLNEANVAESIRSKNHTYFVPVDRSTAKPIVDAVNNVVWNIISSPYQHLLLSYYLTTTKILLRYY